MKKIILIIFLLINCQSYAQDIVCDNMNVADAYKLAINTVNINVRRGILAAGGDYGGEWTRDISINSWNGISFIRPEVALSSLWSVTIHKDTIGHQYWDKIIWVIAAYNHYKASGDKDFLQQAYKCGANTMNVLEKTTFDNKYGLFKGPSVFNDGIAGYASPIYDSLNESSYVLDYKNTKELKCLSTNCIYYGAYQSLLEMAKILNTNKQIQGLYQEKAVQLKASILKHLYSEKENKLFYLIDKDGNVDRSQEGMGISFAVIFGILEKENARQLIQNAKTSKYGITSIYPDFARYSAEKPGRHNNIIWPVVNGFFAQSAIVSNNQETFMHEFKGILQLALDQDKGDYNFREIYNPYTGLPDGGWQGNMHWNSCKLQTWSATAYLNMIYFGFIGMRLENEELSFSPFLPDNIHYLAISNIHYRNAELKVILKGNGKKIKSFVLNGKKQENSRIPSSIKASNEISIELE